MHSCEIHMGISFVEIFEVNSTARVTFCGTRALGCHPDAMNDTGQSQYGENLPGFRYIQRSSFLNQIRRGVLQPRQLNIVSAFIFVAGQSDLPAFENKRLISREALLFCNLYGPRRLNLVLTCTISHSGSSVSTIYEIWDSTLKCNSNSKDNSKRKHCC